jgi:hypothetical protein
MDRHRQVAGGEHGGKKGRGGAHATAAARRRTADPASRWNGRVFHDTGNTRARSFGAACSSDNVRILAFNATGPADLAWARARKF